jgi:hypothetical protein
VQGALAHEGQPAGLGVGAEVLDILRQRLLRNHFCDFGHGI